MAETLIQGGVYADGRGALRFCNDFDMSAVKRFYTVANSAECPKRGWILHKRETKWFFPLRGETTVEVRSEEREERRCFELVGERPAVLCVPPHHWFLIEQKGDAEVMVFSDCFVGEFANDDFRRDCE